MTERYAFRYTEYLIGQKEENKIFDFASDKNPLVADICARFMGCPFADGKAPLASFGIRVPAEDKAIQELTNDVADYGADALRVALLENKLPLTHSQKAAGWRLVDKLWHILQAPTGNVQDWNNQLFYPVIEALQQKDFKRAWVDLKTVLNGNDVPPAVILGVYPFMPHLVQSLCPDIHLKMPDFWNFIQSVNLPARYFVEINGRRVCDFYSKSDGDFEKIKKESLSFPVVQNKIKGKKIQKVINISGKGINFVV